MRGCGVNTTSTLETLAQHNNTNTSKFALYHCQVSLGHCLAVTVVAECSDIQMRHSEHYRVDSLKGR